MARWAHLPVIDDGLDSLKTAVEGAGGRIAVCSGQPANYAGIAAVLLAESAGAPTLIITGAAGSARTCTISAYATISITASDNATHVILHDGVTLWFVTTCTSQALVSGGTVDIPAWTIVVNQPTAP